MQIYDFNDCSFSIKNGAYGGTAGNKDGVVFEGENWMIKYPKNLSLMQGNVASYSTSPLSEYIGSHIFEILGYNVHHTELGIRKGKLVVACKDIETNNSKFLEIRTIKNSYGEQIESLMNDDYRPSSSVTHVVELEEILLHLERNPILSKIDDIKTYFFEQAIIDILIGNNDRNNGNWGLLRTPNEPDRIAPIIDNGASFSSKFREDKIEEMLKSEELKNNCCNVLTAYGKNGHHYSAKKFISIVHSVFEFREAVKKVVPKIECNMRTLEKIIEQLPEEYIDCNNSHYVVCSDIRKEFYLQQLNNRFEFLLKPELEKILNEELENLESEPEEEPDDDIDL